MPAWLTEFFGDRIQVNSLLIVLCFASVLLLESQSAASYPAYLLAISMIASFSQWNDVFKTACIWILIFLIGYLCLSGFWSEPYSARDLAGIFGRGLLVFFFVIAVAECQLRGQVQLWLGRTLAVVGTAAALAAHTVFFLDDPAGGRLSGLGQLDNPVVAGLVFGAVLILLIESFLNDRARGWRIAAFVGAVVVGLAIILSGSRNAWLSSAIGVLVLLCAWKIADRQRFVTTLLTFGVCFIALLATVLSSGQMIEILLPRGDSFRLDIWSVVLEEIADNHLLFGMGITTSDTVTVGEFTFDHPHNMYLAVLFQGGLIALTLFGVLVLNSVLELIKGYELRYSKLALGLISMAAVSYLLDGHELIDKVGETWFLFWLPIGISLGLVWNRTLRLEPDE